MKKKIHEFVYEDRNLYSVLERASTEDRKIMAALISKKTSSNISSEESCPAAISNAFQLMGGHSVINMFRKHGVCYLEIVQNVASRVKVKLQSGGDISELEWQIACKLIENAEKKMNTKQREEFIKELNKIAEEEARKEFAANSILEWMLLGGSDPFIRRYIINIIVAQLLMQSGVRIGASLLLSRFAFAWAGPLGWTLSGLLLAIAVAGPAYKITIPGVLLITSLRANQMAEDAANELGG